MATQSSSSSSAKNLRRRRKQQQQSPKATTRTTTSSSSTNPTTTATTTATKNAAPQSWKQIVFRHPLTILLVLVGIPYGIHLGWRFMVLQHPIWPLATRPAVTIHDKRQVLILGTMSSGTSSMAQYLSNPPFSFEIGHEDSDTTWKYVRDGTISWFHGIRYWPSAMTNNNIDNNNNNSSNRHHAIIGQLCNIQWAFRKYGRGVNFGFGSSLFGNPQYNCSAWRTSLFPEFYYCHRHACRKALEREYACATTTTTTVATTESSLSCTPPFERTILQVREPLKIVASLTVKYCYNETSLSITKAIPTTLQWLLMALQSSSSMEEHCVDQLIHYVYTYYTNIMTADPTMPIYRMEDVLPFTTNNNTTTDNNNTTTATTTTTTTITTDPTHAAVITISQNSTTTSSLVHPLCHVLKLAGLDDLSTTVYRPNHEKYKQLCLSPTPNAAAAAAAKSIIPPNHDSTSTLTSIPITATTIVNAINKGRLSVHDIVSMASPQSILEMKELYSKLGYIYPSTTTTTTTSSESTEATSTATPTDF